LFNGLLFNRGGPYWCCVTIGRRPRNWTWCLVPCSWTHRTSRWSQWRSRRVWTLRWWHLNTADKRCRRRHRDCCCTPSPIPRSPANSDTTSVGSTPIKQEPIEQRLTTCKFYFI
jgi:hypothetical protein